MTVTSVADAPAGGSYIEGTAVCDFSESASGAVETRAGRRPVPGN
jgi:hypothetical protein